MSILFGVLTVVGRVIAIGVFVGIITISAKYLFER